MSAVLALTSTTMKNVKAFKNAALVLFVLILTQNPLVAQTLCPLKPLAGSSTAFLSQLADQDAYHKLIGSESGIDYVKFSIDQTSAATPYFQNTTRYPFHFDFFTTELPQFKNLTFSEYENYLFNPATKRITAGAIYFSKCFQAPGLTGAGMLGFSVYYRNTFPTEEIVKAYQTLRTSIPFMADRIVFLFESAQDYFKYKRLLNAENIPSINMQSFIGSGPKPVSYNAAVSYGYLRMVSPQSFQAGAYNAKDILVLEQVPLDIGPVSGIVTMEIQMPHSHVIFRAKNQKIPNAYIPDADKVKAIKENLDKLVQYEVKSDGTYTIFGAKDLGGEAALQKLADEYFKSRVPVLPAPVRDLSVTDFFKLSNKANPSLVKAYGAKGTNFAILHQALLSAGVDRSYFRGAMLIPFSAYEQHIQQNISDKLCKKAEKECNDDDFKQCSTPADACKKVVGKSISAFLAQMSQAPFSSTLVSDAGLRKSYLSFARNLMIEAPLDATFKSRLITELGQSFKPDQRIRFRSSTNAEDLPGLNGAGLYESEAGCLGDETKAKDSGSACQTPIEVKRITALIDKLTQSNPNENKELIADLKKKLVKIKPIDTAVRKVFASIWGEKAFLFRDYYRIPHMEISMGILEHPAFVDESANGVAIMAGDGSKTTADVVVQKDDTSITNPDVPGAIPDRFLGDLENPALGTLKFLSRSNLTGGTNVLSDASTLSLLKQMKIVYDEMKQILPKEKTFDLEFIASQNGVILIKQVRPLADANDNN